MTAGEEESWDGGGCEGGGGSKAPGKSLVSYVLRFTSLQDILLPKIDLLMPLPPDFGWREHTARTAHVSKRSLTSTVGTSTRNTRDTSNSAA